MTSELSAHKEQLAIEKERNKDFKSKFQDLEKELLAIQQERNYLKEQLGEKEEVERNKRVNDAEMESLQNEKLNLMLVCF